MSDKRTRKKPKPKILPPGKAKALGFVTARHPKQRKRMQS